ncbi:hypothetical protein M407DRAFT_243622 [Tulasnella calospora MUT 4182]|uniref:Protein kinase domain-containing protein n=1 Tax=Tulasnella calospora MUT 4182 TaxID=1051891 RepID=A0A0C3QK69_9AGAM|nr:hypothetical protein M407DRAFT_243622 [Tulasnella calospora MUT 4182]
MVHPPTEPQPGDQTVQRGSRPSKLSDGEKVWVARYEQLKAYGYLLRPRYRPGWIPAWEQNGWYAREEDAILPGTDNLDAERLSDGQMVFLKPVLKTSPEIEIGRLLTSEDIRKDPRNNAIPLLDVIDDPVIPHSVILVLPLLRSIDSPPPSSVGECLDLVDQTLKGLVFLHEHEVAHRDCAMDNIMLDARALLPNGWHPQSFYVSRDSQKLLRIPPIREAGGVRYYFIDFGISTLGQNMTTGTLGQEPAPELSADVPYDPYKLDVYILGMAYAKFLALKFRVEDFSFLDPLIKAMVVKEPSERPTAAEAYELLNKIRTAIPSGELHRRLPSVRQPETRGTKLWRDIQHSILVYWWGLKAKKIVGPLA